MGHKISHTQVGKLLTGLGYSLQANKKTLEGTTHPDRNAQFEYINAQVTARLEAQGPGISFDTKKKELIGRFKNNGRTWRPKGVEFLKVGKGTFHAALASCCMRSD